jgi:N-acyl-D-aspartate/D-glutamate deacylase
MATPLDLAIVNAKLVDGTGGPSRQADVGVVDGRVVTVTDAGAMETSGATEVVDAQGLVLTPGFIDPHTHYDAQLFWDPTGSPSNLHGVTTVIAGNCGFTLAPLDPSNAEYLLKMMCKVEGMPEAALQNGVPWSWRTFGQYLDALEGRLGVNAGFLVGHNALRREVMGPDSVGNTATPEQLAAMRALLAESIAAGGMGFSTTLAYTHSDGDGKPVPSRWSDHDEVLALCEVVKDYEGTTLEFAADGCMNGFRDDEIELATNMSLRGERPLNWNVLTIDSARPDDYRAQLALSDHAAAKGARIVALTMPILVGMNMSFRNYCSFWMLPDWRPTMELPLEDKIAALRDTETRIFLETRAASPDAGVFGRLTGWDRYVIGDTFSPENEGLKGRRVGDIARERGVRPFFALLDIAVNDGLRTILWPGPTDDDAESWRMRAEAWRNPNVMIGGSDAGAHLDRMCGAPYTTVFLADCLRGKQLATLEEAVRLITDVPARLFGLTGRGRIAEGWHADLVVFDPETVGATDVEMVNDLPGGTGRLYAGATGVEYVFVNGERTVEHGTSTGNLPGKVYRSGVDTETNLIPAARA